MSVGILGIKEWMDGCFAFNDHLRDSILAYIEPSPRDGKRREEMIEEKKMS